jgi:hypothetical protein
MSHRTSNQLSPMAMTCEASLEADHAYRKLAQVLDVGSIAREFDGLYSDIGAAGIQCVREQAPQGSG